MCYVLETNFPVTCNSYHRKNYENFKIFHVWKENKNIFPNSYSECVCFILRSRFVSVIVLYICNEFFQFDCGSSDDENNDDDDDHDDGFLHVFLLLSLFHCYCCRCLYMIDVSWEIVKMQYNVIKIQYSSQQRRNCGWRNMNTALHTYTIKMKTCQGRQQTNENKKKIK